MNVYERLEILMRPGQTLVELEPGIYTVSTDMPACMYDARATNYDRVINNWFYNRLMWGTTPAAYRRFAQELHRSEPRVVLDAGCGSMAATADVHAHSGAFVVGVDLSRAMLRKAKQRLTEAGTHNVVLLQADLRDLPFRTGSFEAGLFMGMMHLFPNAKPVLESIGRVMQPQARLYMSTLATVGRQIGDRYYDSLRRMGELAPGRNPEQIERELRAIYDGVSIRKDGNMVFATAFR